MLQMMTMNQMVIFEILYSGALKQKVLKAIFVHGNCVGNIMIHMPVIQLQYFD